MTQINQIRILLLMWFGTLIAAVVLGTPVHADPYCGPGSNYDFRHNICQPGAPVPGGQGVYPYPLPGQEGPGGYGPPSYGSN